MPEVMVRTMECYFIDYYTLYYPFSGNSGRLTWVRLQQPQEQRYPVLQVHFLGLFVFHNSPNSDMDKLIFNVRT